jgi:hypothetical protein
MSAIFSPKAENFPYRVTVLSPLTNVTEHSIKIKSETPNILQSICHLTESNQQTELKNLMYNSIYTSVFFASHIIQDNFAQTFIFDLYRLTNMISCL